MEENPGSVDIETGLDGEIGCDMVKDVDTEELDNKNWNTSRKTKENHA